MNCGWSVVRRVVICSMLVGSVAHAQNPQMAPTLQNLLQKYKPCILERYETQQDMRNRGLSGNLSGLSSTNGLHDRDVVTCVAGNQCSRASRQTMYAALEAQANRGDATDFEAKLKQIIPADCFQCQKHQELHTKHVHCTMDCGGNNGLTQGPCFEGCKAGVDITKLVTDVVNDIHGILQEVLQDLGVVKSNNPAPTPGAAPPPGSYTAHQKPFDLVWDMRAGVDANSLPLNPLWGFQLDHRGQVPDFRASCGSAFVDHERKLDPSILATSCTSQPTTLDLPQQDIPCGLSSDKVLVGHLNWAIASEVGLLYWSEYDRKDGDFNFELTSTDNAAQTTMNVGGEDYGLHLEFKASETVSNFKSPFWARFFQDITSSSSVQNDLAEASVDGMPAVVTGLIGIDGVHGGYTELHPVFSLAIKTNWQAATGGLDESWAFFLRNSGGEGCCSSKRHYWYGLKDRNTLDTWYFIQLPWPAGATSVSVQAGTSQVWSNASNVTGPFISQDSQWTYLGFKLPDPMSSPELDGEISLHYVFPANLPPPKSRPPIRPILRKLVPRGDDWEELRKRMRNPEDQKKLDEALRATQLATVRLRPHTVRLPVVASASIPPHKPIPGPGRNGALTRATAVADSADSASREQLDQNLRKTIPKEILPVKR